MADDGRYPGTDPEQDEDLGEDLSDKDHPSAASKADRAAGGDADTPAGQTESPFSVAFGGDQTLTDRDDDSGYGADGDGDGVLPTSPADSYSGDDPRGVAGATGDGPGEQDSPDPGYTAFADELDDPLADWPAPDTPLASLPEMRRGRGADGGWSERDPFTDDPFRTTAPGAAAQPVDESEPPDDDIAEAAFFDDPVENDPTGGDAGPPPHEAEAGASRVDRDEPAPVAPADAGLAFGREYDRSVSSNETDIDPRPALAPSAPTGTQPGPPLFDDGDDGGEYAYPDIDDLPPGPDNTPGAAGPGDQVTLEDDHDAFVDDFLNDLDDPDDPDLAENPWPARGTAADADDAADIAAPLSSIYAGAQNAAAPDYLSEKDRADDNRAGTRIMSDDGSGRGPGGTEAGTGLPWGMIAIVAVALLLLAAGGFGVVQQRSSLKAEIRDLQAQLATAVAPEEAAAERAQQRRLELENESIAAEVAALEAENESLGDQLSSLEAQLEEQLAAQERAAREARGADEASNRQAQSTAGAPAAPAAGAADARGWFVNFGSYAQEAIARGWADRLEVSNGRVVVQEARASGRTLYRVRVVGLPDQEAAERIATALERQYQLPRLWVGRN